MSDTGPLSFELKQQDQATQARRGTLTTKRGKVQTPAFMPVGTLGTVKGLTIDQVVSTGAEIILGNTYHLALRPGEEIVQKLGGLHQFMGWSKPILTDSGGFQVYSLAAQRKVSEEGVQFRSHIDGRLIHLTPERSIEIQAALGSDIAMVFDEVIALPAKREEIASAMERSIRWAKRCQQAATREDQSLFAIVQGGLEEDLRIECSQALTELNFPGYAVGGLSVGEPPEEMYRMLDVTCPHLPTEKPRYLMGVGTPIDLLEGISRGIDLFDCVMPTRNGRNALAFTDEGPLRLRNQKHQLDPRPLDPTCPSLASSHSRAYIRHLFASKEMLGPILLTHHNLCYYQKLMRDARTAIEAGRFEEFKKEKMKGWNQGNIE
ncbi:Queuine tRNA-ribosyltransferase [Planctomycetales bacterium 10988]|nr:Queuine tRNA-ribosyltransferase [Planctomycetales bacterium 10988]